MKRWRAIVVGLNHYHVTGWVESLGALGDRIEMVGRHDLDPTRERAPGPDHVDPNLAPAFPETIASAPFDTNLDRLIRETRPDFALITLPNALAPDAIATCARHGVHVLVDKPGARTAAEAERAFGAARDAGIKVAVGLSRRYGRGWQEVAALRESGRLGRLLSTEAIFVTSSVAVRDPSNPIFRRDEMGGGILHWLGIHDLDELLWLTGDRIVEVQAMTATAGDPTIDVEDVVSASVRYASGAIGTVHHAYALPRPGGEGWVGLRGTQGSVTIQPSGDWSWTGGASPLEPIRGQHVIYDPAPSTGYGGAGVVVIDDLLRAIEEDRQPLATGQHIIDALRVIDAIYAAAETGQRVRVPHASGDR